MGDGKDRERSDGSPYFPAPRDKSDANAPYRVVATGSMMPSAPSGDRPIVVTRVVTRPSEEPLEPVVRVPTPLPPYRLTEAEIRTEIMRASIDTTPLLVGRMWFGALLLTRPKWTGAIALVAGLVMIGHGVLIHHVTVGPTAIFTGIGWILCDRIPMSRAGWRLLAIVAFMIAGLWFEVGLTRLGWIKA